MAWRTTTDLVQRLLGAEYGELPKGGGFPDLNQYIEPAHSMVNRLVVKQAEKGIRMTDPDLELLERWLACHFYQQMDPGYNSRSNAGASGSFQGAKGEGLESTRFGRGAISLDYTNCLRNVDKQQKAGSTWLGKTPSGQTDYRFRS